MATAPLPDTQLFILSHAAQHPEGRVLPLPTGIHNKGGAATRALKSLLRRQYVEESIARREDQEWSRAETGERLALMITPAGLAAIGVSEAPKQVDDLAKRAAPGPVASRSRSRVEDAPGTKNSGAADAVFRTGTKGAAIVELLQRKAGATLLDLTAASGWQAHSVRGFLSGTLRKKHRLVIASDKAAGTRRYRIAS